MILFIYFDGFAGRSVPLLATRLHVPAVHGRVPVHAHPSGRCAFQVVVAIVYVFRGGIYLPLCMLPFSKGANICRHNNNFDFYATKTYVIYVAVNRIQIVRSLEGRFEEAVIAYLFLVNILPVCIVPLIWTETHKLSNVLNAWTDFEVYTSSHIYAVA